MRVASKALAAGAALTVMLTACGGGASGNTEGEGNVRQAVMAVQSLPDNLTLFPYGGNASQTVLSGLGSQLAGYEPQGCENAVPGPVVGKLAESIQLDADKKALTIKLKKLKSQVGNTLSSEDVRWSFVDYGFVIQPVLKKTFGSSGFDVDNLVTVIDDSTLKLNLKAWNSYSDEMLQNPLAYIYDSTEAKKHVTSDDPVAQKWLFKHLADYSGWKLEEFTAGQSLSVTADDSWGGGERNIDQARPVHRHAVGGVEAILGHVEPALSADPVADLEQAHHVVRIRELALGEIAPAQQRHQHADQKPGGREPPEVAALGRHAKTTLRRST